MLTLAGVLTQYIINYKWGVTYIMSNNVYAVLSQNTDILEKLTTTFGHWQLNIFADNILINLGNG